jgi:Sec-independent protein translocase protein TatA
MIQQIFVVAQTAEPVRSVLLQTPKAWTFAIFPCIMLLVVICFWGLVIFGLVKLIKYLGSAGREQKLIRMELSKLADEVQQIRQELKAKPINQTSADR